MFWSASRYICLLAEQCALCLSLDVIARLYILCYSVQYQEGQKRRKPNYSSVDLSEVEWEDKDDIVRENALL